MRTLVVLLIGAVLLCSANAFLDELLAESVNDMTDKRACFDKYKSNICGGVISPAHCVRRSGRMAKFAKENCAHFCGFC
ncbi:protein Class8-like [Nematostella vectensis]|uniref:Protein Class8-like n=1 Tax=Nematostella vectensis TaxID=45351 RepID=CL8L_NEMVE|nr:protein Class8-like [Nematostella vectensis]P0DQR8.1 RecName: Full=Protein Class8-like; Flags: Precursor [Nematostella vectensis]